MAALLWLPTFTPRRRAAYRAKGSAPERPRGTDLVPQDVGLLHGDGRRAGALALLAGEHPEMGGEGVAALPDLEDADEAWIEAVGAEAVLDAAGLAPGGPAGGGPPL